MIKIAIVCGGPSPERGISLNSARTVIDHLPTDQFEVYPLYVNPSLEFFQLSQGQLYSNTPSDFDFKLAQIAKPLSYPVLIEFLKCMDMVFPVMHGAYGEDGVFQDILDRENIPHVGASSDACKRMFFKNKANNRLSQDGYATLPFIFIGRNLNYKSRIKNFWETHNLKRAIIKPSAGGSSLGVASVKSLSEAYEKADHLLQTMGVDLIMEPFCEGREFTVCVVEDKHFQPVSLVPSEIVMDYGEDQIFDFRRKYLPSGRVRYECPPTFSTGVTAAIQSRAEDIYKLFGGRDFLRIDGWVLNDGRIIFSDINPISGMDQNSFLFQQAARIGWSHSDLLCHVLNTALRRVGKAPARTTDSSASAHSATRKPVNVIFGGEASERQVSLMSGSNVWLKLTQSREYKSIAYLLDSEGAVWELPYMYVLTHTVEEILHACKNASNITTILQPLADKVRARLELKLWKAEAPIRYSLEEFLDYTKQQGAFLFNALHGGIGENGQLQKMVEAKGLRFNGSKELGARVAMDKADTAERIAELKLPEVVTIAKTLFARDELKDLHQFIESYAGKVPTPPFILKPQNDGCSTGVVKANSLQELAPILKALSDEETYLERKDSQGNFQIIELPTKDVTHFMFEPYIDTDRILIKNHELQLEEKTGWLEFTVGVVEQMDGTFKAMHPSITVAEAGVLSVEEKFQGGTGVNITPPPEDIVSPALSEIIRSTSEKVASALHVSNYCRIDIFANRHTHKVIVIEINALPALTPSTVIYHQALADRPSKTPLQFLEALIQQASQ